jgi:DNA processing protein
MSSAPKPGAASQRADDTHAWLALYRTPGAGNRRLLKLIDRFGSPAAVLAAGDQLHSCDLAGAALDYLLAPDWDAIERDLSWLNEDNNHLLTCQDPRYPPLLAEIADPPVLLFVHGDPDYLRQPQIAIVGSRNPSHAGVAQAEDFARFLGNYGLTITSGLATGIDAAAHRGALTSEAGTIAVTGTGLDRVYPACHRELAHQIAANGALVSEFPPGAPPRPDHFPRRNRIISGLGLGTLVVEAAVRSGSLITARNAIEQGREVFAMPGSIHNPLAHGCHALIRQGAKLVESGEHILEELNHLVSPGLTTAADSGRQDQAAPPKSGKLAGEYTELLDAMGYEPVSVNELVQRSGLTPEQVSSMLLLLELEDRVHSGAGGRYTRSR